MAKQQWHSGFDDSSGWGRLIDPVCLFILCQIAGTLWVIIPREPPRVNPPGTLRATFAVEASGLEEQRVALERAIRLARAELQSGEAKTAFPSEEGRALAQVRMEEQQLKDLETRRSDLQRKEGEVSNQIATTPGPSLSLAQESEQVRKQLQSKQDEIKRLRDVLEHTTGPNQGEGVGSPKATDTDLRPKLLQLIGGNAIPVDRDHYNIREGFLRDRRTRAEEYTKKTVGETIDEIGRPGSEFMAYLRAIDPSKEYLLCLLNNDSFALFREVRKLASSKGIKVGWDTAYRTDGIIVFILGAGEGSKIPGPLE